VLFGFAIDHSCLLWEQKCDGGRGACLYYDTHQMAWLLMAVCVACKLANIACGLVAWRLYVHQHGRRRRDHHGSVPQTAAEFMLGVPQSVLDAPPLCNYGSTENINSADADETDDAYASSNPALELANNDIGQR